MNTPCRFAAALLACGCAQAAPRATLELLPQAQVAGEAVTLGQVAHLSSPDLALLRQLVHLGIGRLSRSGEPASVRRELLAQWIQRETGLGPGELAWEGSEAVRVSRATQQVKGAELARAARDALRAVLAQRGVPGEPRTTRAPRDMEAPAGELQLRPRSLEGLPLRSRMLVWVEVWSEGEFVRAVAVPLELDATLTAAAPLAPVASLRSAGGQRAQGQAPALLVERGAWATLRSTDGAVSLESKVTVLQDGRAGEHVRVRAPGGGGIVFARVVGPAQLELAP